MRLSRSSLAVVVGVLVVVIGLGLALALTNRQPPAARNPTPSPEATPSADPSPQATLEPTLTPEATPLPTATGPTIDQAMLDSRLTILLLGLDSNYARAPLGQETNTDAMVVVSVNAAHTQVATLALPRDTVDIPMPDGSVWTDKANKISRILGLDAARGAFESLLAIEIDYYIQVDMDDLVSLVDAVGGVDVEVPNALYDPALNLALEPGLHHLDGATAQYYVRTRVDGDYNRGDRQQQVFLALARKFADPAAEIDPFALLAYLGSSVVTDMPLDRIPTLIEIARRSTTAEVSSQVLRPPRFALFEGEEGPARGWVMIPNVPEMRAYAQSVMGGE